MYNHPVVVKMGASRRIARRSPIVPEAPGKGYSVPQPSYDKKFTSNDSLYIKRDVENGNELIHSLTHMLAGHALLHSAGQLHMTVLQSATAHRLGLAGQSLRTLNSAANRAAPSITRPQIILFDRLARYPSKDGFKTLVSLTFDSEGGDDVLSNEVAAAIQGIGAACNYEGGFNYTHHPHITIAVEDQEPPSYQETLLESPISAHLAKASFFAQRLV